MEFDQLIKNKLQPMFKEHGFKISEQSKGTLKYESEKLIVCLIHNVRENSNTLWVGRKHSSNFIEIDNYIMDGFFSSDLKINNLPQNTFVENLFIFFGREGRKLLKGDESEIKKLEDFDNIRSEEYTLQLLNSQYLEAADKAWKNKNYEEFIIQLKKVNKGELTPSLNQKLKIAKSRIK